jgi:hypothetical protein
MANIFCFGPIQTNNHYQVTTAMKVVWRENLPGVESDLRASRKLKKPLYN